MYFTKSINIQCSGIKREGESCIKNEKCRYPTCSSKLFLCTRDISETEEIYFEPTLDKGVCRVITEHDHKYRTSVMFKRQKDSQDMLVWKDDCFKVVGEISTDVLPYIKEGDYFMEFDEDLIN